MTLSVSTAPGRLGAYARLAKLDVWDYYLALPLAWSLAGPSRWWDGGVLGTLALFGLGTVGVIAAAVAFDDVTGFRDGTDAANYGPDAPARSARPIARKPLLTGELTERQAVRFGWGAAAAGALLWACAVLAAPFGPLWTVLLVLLCLVTAVQYSWGFKLSYRGWQEVFLAGFGAGLVLCAVGLTTGTASGLAVVQAVLFGLGPLLFGVYSNTRDAAGDARVGRPTAAVVLSARGNRAFIAALSVAETALIAGSVALGVAPWWFLPVLLPAIVLRTAQLRRGVVRNDPLGARVLGLRAHRLTVVLLIAANVTAGAGS